ncbi:STAS domain-containing protein [Thiomonas sp.]
MGKAEARRRDLGGSRQGASFLERLGRFLRHPTTDWSQTRFDPDAQRDKAREEAQRREAQRMARAAVLVRNREFDLLRQALRNRRSQSAEPLEGLSIPATQPPPLQAATRQHTLHKIDAIERQMQSEQARQYDSTLLSGAFDPTLPATTQFAASTLRPGSPRRATPRWGASQLMQMQPRRAQPGREVATSPAWASSAGEPSALPLPAVVELAAFDFAEKRDAQVESQLLTALQIEPARSPAAQQIFQALLDFYWATAQQDKLDARALDYVQRYRRTPLPRPPLQAARAGSRQTADFVAAEHFDILQLRAFERFVADPATHLTLDWSALIDIPESQHAALAQALRHLNERRVELELLGVDLLLAATRLHAAPEASASAAASAAADAELRLQVLRLAGDEAGFTDLAVELSVASGCSPVDWTPPRFQRVSEAAARATTQLATLQTGRRGRSTTEAGGGLAAVVVGLRGELSDAAGTSFLRELRLQAGRSDAISVDLSAVQRVDFAAATALLNWDQAQVELGKSVEFRGAHTLLAPFLQSVGLHLSA